MIVLENLSIGYAAKNNRKIVVENIDAELREGELTCLIGPNGIGKSTLLRTLSAFLPAIKGHISIDGKYLDTLSAKEVSRQIGVVLTSKPRVQNITVTELVGLGRSPYTGFWGTLDSKDRDVVDESISQTGIEHLAGRMIQTLSDGERQKVMIAKALAQQTPVIYLDEPTAFLDYPSKVDMLILLRNLAHDTGKTIFLSTHDLELALQLADRLWLLHPETTAGNTDCDNSKGKPEGKTTLQIGTPDELSKAGLLASFIERPGIHFHPDTLTISVDK
ncbi:MAG: ABC transporter ATP-binding protein [Prevotella sp.]|uniref:ABC transporter ATP-binding protein n=1 Tax=Prevotella sp. TaxID=59823 RepID=UPI002A2BAC1A|nr:ABC transporter ATP-binding protein [Prevotella sp.]MDD7317501.1 ABC transporter ATP-binding protein [Prevotellaceae bacterium]MDY4019163.1 ABC transporter ATP-binding protein [Prevotella sp.]